MLNERDAVLLRLLAVGMSVAQIAAAMEVTTNTTRTRIRRIQVKLSVVGRSGLVREARARGAL